ncbi:diphosphomevalonate decarboxylase [Candidatus Gottesmanbacteria bacterium]|nr:diphosphomevalonate decarboxylase [Candidatus Gottesmanbacteria bacterium]
MKATAAAPSNLAFIKYWGKVDENLNLPANSSISMNLSGLLTTTTVHFDSQYKSDSIIIDGRQDEKEGRRVISHLNRVRKIAKITLKAKVVSQNNFPVSTGLSSSASGFAALTLSASTAAGLKLTEIELSTLARQASGSACRSIPGGFVEWKKGKTSGDSFSYSLYPPNWWDIVDIVLVLNDSKKDVSTTEGQKLVLTSPFFTARLERIEDKIKKLKKSLAEKDFSTFGRLAENEALELHSIMFTSTPALIYLLPETLFFMKEIIKWRKEGLEAYFSLNTGQALHILCQGNDLAAVKLKLAGFHNIKKIIISRPEEGARIIKSHLF